MSKSLLRSFAVPALLWIAMVVGAYAQDATPPPTNDAQSVTDAATAASPREPQTKVTAKPLMNSDKDVTPPRALYSPNATYSDEARRAHYQANVVLGMVVAADGLVNDVRVIQSAGLGLDEEAVKAVKTWRFQPATKDGQPVSFQMQIQVNFRLTDYDAESPLSSPPEANANPPQFPNVNLTKYPLILNVARASGVAEGRTYRIFAHAMISDAVGKESFAIFCDGNKLRCVFLSPGNYPARWIAGNHRIEILGKDSATSDWRRAEYTLKPE